MKKLIIFFSVFISCLSANAATYTVKTSGGNYTSPGTCANAASPGDVCEVYNGSYSGWTQSASGSAGGGYITVRAASGQTPILTSSISLGGRSYIHIEGFTISGTIGCSTLGSYLKVINNNVTNMMTFVADYVLISGNTFNNMPDDAIRQFGRYFVVRGNSMVTEADTNDEHMDMWQSWCESGRTVAASFLVFEDNYFVDVSGGNVHFTLTNSTNDCTTGYPTKLIYRYNKVHNIGSRANYIDANAAHTSTAYNHIYNNTYSYLGRGAETTTTAASMTASNYSSAKNNIVVNSLSRTNATGWYPPSTGWVQAYNLYYSSNGTISFSGAASSETGAVKNQNPLLSNPTALDFSISSSSPARDSGTALTTVAASDTSSGTSLVLTDASYFSWGWGIADADWIAVGSVTNIAQISTINYDTNTVTLTSSISRSDGDSVWLYKLSDGTRVLYGSAPDIGAVEYNVDGGDETAPLVTIQIPVEFIDTYSTSSGTINLSGIATDAVGVTSVSWSNDRGGSGTCTGTTSWSQSNITLQTGANVITITARDAANNDGVDTLTVTYTPSDTTTPVISSLLPTGAQSCTGANVSNITISLSTNEAATCRMAESDTAYASMTDTFTTTGGTSHSETKSLACGQTVYTYYVRCIDASSNANTSSEDTSFWIVKPGAVGVTFDGGTSIQ